MLGEWQCRCVQASHNTTEDMAFKERMGGMYECLWGQDSSNMMSGADWTL